MEDYQILPSLSESSNFISVLDESLLDFSVFSE